MEASTQTNYFVEFQSALIIGVTLLGILIVFFIYKSKRNTKKQQQEEITQIHVHKKPEDSSIKKQQTEEIKQIKKAKKKSKSSKSTNEKVSTHAKTQKQLQEIYSEFFYGTINLKPQSSINLPIAMAFRGSKILISNTKNQLILYDLKKWKKDTKDQPTQKYFTSLDNNQASAVFIGPKYYYVALTFDKTIAYYQFVGENGVYFKEVKRFFRNILKSDASSIYAPDSQKFIVTSGSQADTIINVWSMKGQKLVNFNTYQIEHYDIKYGNLAIMIRGWTSEVKVYDLITNKDDSFFKLQKSHHLSHSENPISSSICNLGLYGLTVSNTHQIALWKLKSSRTQNSSNLQPKIIEPYNIELDDIGACLVHTLVDLNERYKTIIVFTDPSSKKIAICDQALKVHFIFQGVECKNIFIVGSMKNAVLITENNVNGKLFVWNITSIIQKIFDYSL